MSTSEAIARITKPYGIAGELVISLYDTFPDRIDTAEPLMVIIDSLPVPLFLVKFQRRGQSGGVVSFADFDTPERSALLLGLELHSASAPRPAQAEKNPGNGEIYFEDLVGFEASFEGSALAGTVTDFMDDENNPLFTVDVAGTEVFIPAIGEMIEDFDIEKRTIRFSLPDGLLELYL